MEHEKSKPTDLPFVSNQEKDGEGRMTISRTILGIPQEIVMTPDELEQAYRKKERAYKLEDAIYEFSQEFGQELELSSMNEAQKDWLLKMNSRFEDALREDSQMVWQSVIHSRLDELKIHFPHLVPEGSDTDET